MKRIAVCILLICLLSLSTAHASLFFTDWELRRVTPTDHGTYLLLFRNNVDEMAPIQWVIAEAVRVEDQVAIVAYAYAVGGKLEYYVWSVEAQEYVRR